MVIYDGNKEVITLRLGEDIVKEPLSIIGDSVSGIAPALLRYGAGEITFQEAYDACLAIIQDIEKSTTMEKLNNIERLLKGDKE